MFTKANTEIVYYAEVFLAIIKKGGDYCYF